LTCHLQQGIRTYSTVPPPNQSAPNPEGGKGGKNTALYTILGFAAAGTAYYYYVQQADRRVEAKVDVERLKGKAQDAADSAKGTSEQVRKGYEQLKVNILNETWKALSSTFIPGWWKG